MITPNPPPMPIMAALMALTTSANDIFEVVGKALELDEAPSFCIVVMVPGPDGAKQFAISGNFDPTILRSIMIEMTPAPSASTH